MPDAKKVRALIGEKMKSDEWTKEQVAALLAKQGGKKLADLSAEGLSNAWRILKTESGASWEEKKTDD